MTSEGSSFTMVHPGVRIVSGPGALRHTGEEAERLGAERVLVVCGRSIAERTPALQVLREGLGSRLVETFTGVVYDTGARADARARMQDLAADARPDLVVSVGGGIAIGYARQLTLHMAGGDPAAPRTPIITVPTTLSGAEANVGYITVDGQSATDSPSRPVTAILDAELARHTPRELFLSSGFNGLHHCFEGTYSTQRNLLADGVYLHAARLLVQALPGVAADPDDLEARGRALLGGYLSGLMIESTWLGIGHALCHGLQSVCGTPHGLNNTVMLTRAIRYNLAVAADRIASLAPALGVSNGATARETAEGCISAVEELRRSLSLPDRLRDVPGVRRDLFPRVAEVAVRDFFTPYNPRSPEGLEELLQVLDEAW